MKEEIIYSNYINEVEFLRSLSIYGTGISSFNRRVYRFNDLIENAANKLGILGKRNILNRNDIMTYLQGNLNKKELGGTYKFRTIDEVRHVFNTITNVRKCIEEDDEYNVFKEKVVNLFNENINVNILSNVFLDILNNLNNEFECDHIKLCREVIKENKKLYKEIIVLEEEKDNISKLEYKLLETISDKVTFKSILDFYNVDKKTEEKKANIKAYFGEKTEVDSVLSDIANKGYALDECLILLATKNRYVHLLNEQSIIHNIPMTFETGLPLYLSDSFKLFKTLNDLEGKYFFDVNGYEKLFNTESFDISKTPVLNYEKDVAGLLGRLKINFDAEHNKTALENFNSIEDKYKNKFLGYVDRDLTAMNESCEILPEFINIMSLGKEEIIKNFTKFNLVDTEFSEKCNEHILKTLNSSKKLEAEFQDSYIAELDSSYIHRKVFNSGTLHVAEINNGLSTFRKHIYILGLSSKNFPGRPTEDYLMSNRCYECLTNIKSKSNEDVKRKNEFLKRLIDNYLCLGADLNLSYSAKDIKEVKDVNPSSTIFEYAHKIKDNYINEIKENIRQFDNDLSTLNKIAEASVNNKEVIHEEWVDKQVADNNDLTKRCYSPSAIGNFMECPLRFYINNILYADKSDSYDPINTLQPNIYGNLVHLVMEMFVKERSAYTDKNKFLELAKDVYEAYSKFDVSIINFKNQYDDFIDNCSSIYDEINNYTFFDAEVSIKNQDLFGIKFNGSIDLVVKDKANEYIIYDYKTGRSIKHLDDDFKSCIQGIIYSYLLEKQKSIKVSKVIFYYPKFNQEVVFNNPLDSDTENKLHTLIDEFLNALKYKKFDICKFSEELKESNVCKYCKHEQFCPKKRG